MLTKDAIASEKWLFIPDSTCRITLLFVVVNALCVARLMQESAALGVHQGLLPSRRKITDLKTLLGAEYAQRDR